MGKLGAEGLYLPTQRPQCPSQGYWPWQDLRASGPPESCTPSALPPTLARSQTSCKNCSWSKWSSARSWSENFRVSKVPPSCPTPPHPTSRPEPSSLPSLAPGPQCQLLPCALQTPGALLCRGFPLDQRLGVGVEDGEGGNGAEGGGLCLTALT